MTPLEIKLKYSGLELIAKLETLQNQLRDKRDLTMGQIDKLDQIIDMEKRRMELLN